MTKKKEPSKAKPSKSTPKKRGPKPGTKYKTKKALEKLKEKPVTEKIIEALYERGITDKEFADIMELHVSTIHRYKQDENFLRLLKKAKGQADELVEMSLFKNAVGFSVMETQLHNYQGEITKTLVEKHYKGETAAQFIWLKNRRPDMWRDKIEGNAGALPEDEEENFKEVHIHVHASNSKLIPKT